MLDKKKKRSSSSSSAAREDWAGHQQAQQVSERKTDLEKLYRGETTAGETGQVNQQHQQQQQQQQQDQYWNGKGGGYQTEPGYEEEEPPVEVEKFYWNDSVPGKQGQAHLESHSQGSGEHNPVRKPKLNGLREFQNFNDEEKLYLFSSTVKQPVLANNSNPGGAAVKQNTEEKLHWAGSGSSQAALYRSYLQSYEASRWRPANDKRQLQSRLAQFCSRPASSLGMAARPSPSLGSPSIRYNRHRRSSMSYYEENLQPGPRTHWRSNSMDILPYVEKEREVTGGSHSKHLKISMMRATQFTDQYSPLLFSQPDYNNGCQETIIGSPKEVCSVTTRQGGQFNPVNINLSTARAVARANPVSSADPVVGVQHGGSNEDMKKVLMELDNTGYFAEELLDSTDQVAVTVKDINKKPVQPGNSSGQMDYKKLWEDSKLHNVQLQKELNEVKSDLESVRSQLETMAIRAVNQKSVSDAEKREKLIVIKKLEGLEKELKLLAYSESLTDQTLDQLRLENNRLREENLALLRVMDKIVKN